MSTDLDLASRWLGASVVAASDDAFGDKENLLKDTAPVAPAGVYGNRGEIVDGWETRRRRDEGRDWAIVRLGAPGVIASVDVDTTHFTGNYPESCRVEACGREGYPSPSDLLSPRAEWTEIVRNSPLRGDSHNIFSVSDPTRFTHVRLSIYPDGGVARFRVLGIPVPDPRLFDGLSVDLAGQDLGSAVVASSDSFYTSARLLNRPDTPRTMGEGWETRRRRDKGPDSVIFRLGVSGVVRQAVIDTAHFKYNASSEVELWASSRTATPSMKSSVWQPLLSRTRLQPDTRHRIPITIPHGPVSSIRLDAFPDGGLSRVRLIGVIDAAARRDAGYRWFNSMPHGETVECLGAMGIPGRAAAAIATLRPVSSAWTESVREAAGRLTSAQVEALRYMLEGPATGETP